MQHHKKGVLDACNHVMTDDFQDVGKCGVWVDLVSCTCRAVTCYVGVHAANMYTSVLRVAIMCKLTTHCFCDTFMLVGQDL
jgi:hypothetical protein